MICSKECSRLFQPMAENGFCGKLVEAVKDQMHAIMMKKKVHLWDQISLQTCPLTALITASFAS